ncbi:MAG: adenylate kinase family protein [Patescibacteria group bacterium]
MRIILIGPPASGKGTQAELLAKKLKLPLISTGNFFRWQIKKNTSLGKKIKKIVERGKLVPDQITNKIIEKEIKSKKKFILDGYPRNLNQANYLKSLTDIDIVFEIWISKKEILKRLTGRRVCSCGATYHLIYAPPKNDEICDKCGRKLFIREDDKKTNVLKRISIYQKETKPLIDFYRKEKKLIKINGQQPILKVFKDIIEKLKNYDYSQNKRRNRKNAKRWKNFG